jgi:hypothetical protein
VVRVLEQELAVELEQEQETARVPERDLGLEQEPEHPLAPAACPHVCRGGCSASCR